jgi:hypothetical protein
MNADCWFNIVRPGRDNRDSQDVNAELMTLDHGLGAGKPVMLPDPDVLVLIRDESGWYLDRYTAQGEFGGDSWHESRDDAVIAAVKEHGPALGDWVPMPATCGDPVQCAISTAQRDRR